LVRLALKEPYIIGKIANIEDGGLIAPSAGPLQRGIQMPGKLEIKFEMTVHFNPGAAIGSLLCLLEPSEERKPADASEGAPADS
jgi:hypothetical protein